MRTDVSKVRRVAAYVAEFAWLLGRISIPLMVEVGLVMVRNWLGLHAIRIGRVGRKRWRTRSSWRSARDLELLWL